MTRSLSEITRRENRIFVSLPVTLQPAWDGGGVSYGSTINYSTQGIRVRSTLPFEPGKEVGVAVRHEDPHPKNYNVVWVRRPKGEEAIYEAGLELRRDPLV